MTANNDPDFSKRWKSDWEWRLTGFIDQCMADADPAHDRTHLDRVVRLAEQLATVEGGNLAVVLPAAWLHDCVILPKNSPHRRSASRLSAERAVEFLSTAGYPPSLLSSIFHAIEAHSFSAKISAKTLEAEIVQDADRLDSLGAIGLARCLATGGALNRMIFDPFEPFPVHRQADDSANSIDHLFVKLLRLPDLLNTSTARKMAVPRQQFLLLFLSHLAQEQGIAPDQLAAALGISGGNQST